MIRTPYCKTDHTRFGGIIYPTDFETKRREKNNQNGSLIASRIISDRRFDEQCRQNIQGKTGRNKYAIISK